MRKLFLSLILVLTVTALRAQNTSDSTGNTAGVPTGSTEELLSKAGSSYSKGRYSEAAAIYESLLAKNGPSDKLYYNLGNAYFKSDRLAPAILNYERALRLNPSDQDAQFNLSMCEAKIVDKIDPIGMFIVVRFYKSIGQLFNSNNWAFISIAFFLLFIGSLCAYFFAKVLWLKKSGFFAGIAALGLSLLSMVYSAEASSKILHPNEAVLFSLSVTVKSSPDKSGTDIFVLHEGTKMKIRGTLGEWSEIELEDGNVGWLLTKNIEII